MRLADSETVVIEKIDCHSHKSQEEGACHAMGRGAGKGHMVVVGGLWGNTSITQEAEEMGEKVGKSLSGSVYGK